MPDLLEPGMPGRHGLVHLMHGQPPMVRPPPKPLWCGRGKTASDNDAGIGFAVWRLIRKPEQGLVNRCDIALFS